MISVARHRTGQYLELKSRLWKSKEMGFRGSMGYVNLLALKGRVNMGKKQVWTGVYFGGMFRGMFRSAGLLTKGTLWGYVSE